MEKRIFMTFADTSMSKTVSRIRNEAEQSGFFNQIITLSELDFEPSYREQYDTFISSHKRGYGYWIWKSHFILRQLLAMEEGDFLIYLDSGCEINKNGSKRYHEYLEMAKNANSGIVCFSTGSPDKNYSKGDLIDYFGLRGSPILETSQIMSGILIFYCNNASRSLVRSWYQITHSNLHLIDDSPSASPNESTFIENRHDQAVLSLLIKTSGGATIISGKEVDIFPPTNKNWRRLKKYPFLATRNRKGEPRLGNHSSIILCLLNLKWDIEIAIADIIVQTRITVGRLRQQLFKT